MPVTVLRILILILFSDFEEIVNMCLSTPKCLSSLKLLLYLYIILALHTGLLIQLPLEVTAETRSLRQCHSPGGSVVPSGAILARATSDR